MKKKIYILLAAIMGFVLMANVQVYALSSALDIDALKEEIKQELRNERPWQSEMDDWGIDIHGFVSQGYMNSEHYNYMLYNSKGGSFHFNEIGINFSKELTDRLRIGLQLLSRDLGDLHNNKVTVDWAYADYAWTDWLGVRAGILKIPNGFYNESRDIDMLRTCILLPLGVYNESFRDIYMGLSGISLYGSIPMGGLGSLDYQLMMGTQNMDVDNSGISNDIENTLNRELPGLFDFLGRPDIAGGSPEERGQATALGGTDFDFDDFDMEEDYVASIQWRSPWGLRLGATIQKLDFDLAGTYAHTASGVRVPFGLDVYQIEQYTLSSEYTIGDLILACEYWHLVFDAKATVNNDMISDSTTEKEGWYVSGSYRVNDWLELGSYYTVFYADAQDHVGKDIAHVWVNNDEAWTRDLALSTRFDVNEYWTVKLEGHKMEGKANLHRAQNDNFGNTIEDDFYVFVAKITFSF